MDCFVQIFECSHADVDEKVHDEIGHFDFQLSGLETASTPMIVGIPIYAQVFGVNLNGFSIRKEQKTYAMKNWLEGGATEQPVMLMDDLSNSGDSLRKSLRHFRMASHGYI